MIASAYPEAAQLKPRAGVISIILSQVRVLLHKPESSTQRTLTKSTRGNLPTFQGGKTRIPHEFS